MNVNRKENDNEVFDLQGKHKNLREEIFSIKYFLE